MTGLEIVSAGLVLGFLVILGLCYLAVANDLLDSLGCIVIGAGIVSIFGFFLSLGVLVVALISRLL